MPLYLGFDASTQSLTALVLEMTGERRRVVFAESLDFDTVLPAYGTRHGVLTGDEPLVATSSPIMWAEALDLMMARLARSVDVAGIAAVSGSAQQHGSVYLNPEGTRAIASLNPARPLAGQLRGAFSREASPIWMDASTHAECGEIADAVGGAEVLARRTGSRAFERFTAPQIRKFFKRAPDQYANTERIHLVSSFHTSLLVGAHAPIDRADASGMNLMDLASDRWWPRALDATAPGLLARLPPIVESWTSAGPLAPYWRERYRLPPADVIAWSGDNPSSLIGTGLVREGRVAISLGTSDTVFGLMNAPRVDPGGTGHVFGAPTGAFMGLTCFQNGSIARERVRHAYGLSWEGFSRALEATPPGNDGGTMLPWFEPEITPPVLARGVRRHGLPAGDPARNVRALVEGQQMSMALHSRWMGVTIDTIHATGGAAVNRGILQVMADVFGADVYQMSVANSAALGAALRAAHGHMKRLGRTIDWDELVAGVAEPVKQSRLRPRNHDIYERLLPVYAARQTEASGQA